jgi:hypothetical protein
MNSGQASTCTAPRLTCRVRVRVRVWAGVGVGGEERWAGEGGYWAAGPLGFWPAPTQRRQQAAGSS